jgi:hypothetical protein
MPNTSWLRPGAQPAEIGRRLREAGLAAPDEIVDWFAWHEGAHALKASEGYWGLLGPSGFRPQTIDEALEERRLGLQLRRELVEIDGIPEEDVVGWRITWLPIGRALSGTVLVADLGGGPADDVPIFVIDWEDWDSFAAPCAPSLASVITTWLDVLQNHTEWVGGLEGWNVRFDDVPAPLRKAL